MAAVLPPLYLAVDLAQLALQPAVPLAVQPVQAQLAEDHLAQEQHLQDHLVYLDPVVSLVNQLLEVSVVSAPLPMDQQDFPMVDSQDTSDSHHPAPAPVAELAASALPTWVDLQAPNLALET